MIDDVFARVEEVFHEALELEPGAQDTYLDEACEGDAGLRAEVDRLLARHGEAGEFLETPPTRRVVEAEAAAPKQIGEYRIRRVLATGGMGIVYEATQEHPHRLVALKVLKRGAASRQAMRRFHHEAEILGRLRHPNIAQIYGAGTYDTGEGARPYFAMELVKGRPLTRYCDGAGLGTRERLEFFARVCDAVQYAHHKGVIHRDLKPDNVLVDDLGEPKILDFGIARATDSDVQATTLRTDIGQLIGTVPYMSPEQVSGDPAELDTRSDIYSLGVVLYELLCGRLPHDLTGKTIPEAVRVIREEDPRPLSSVNRTLRGDVETIVAKALEKDKERRYQSAADLAGDVRRYLGDQPIVARPPSTFYQLRKFARRNKALVGGLAAAFVVLLAGAATTTWQAVRAIQQESAARAEAEKATAINEFLMWTLALPNPTEEAALTPGARVTTILDLLDGASERLDDALAEYPLELADLHERFAQTYFGLGPQDKWLHHLERALELRRDELGTDHPETLRSLERAAFAYNQMGRHDDAETRFRSAVESLERVVGPEDRQTLLAKRGLGFCIGLYQQQSEAGAQMLRETLETARRVLGDTDTATFDTAIKLLLVYSEMGDFDAADRLAREWLAICAAELGDDHNRTVGFRDTLGQNLVDRGDPAAAEQILRDNYEAYISRYGYMSAGASNYALSLAEALQAQERYDEAEQVLLSMLEDTANEAGEGVVLTFARYRLGVHYFDTYELDKAEVLLRRAGEDFARYLWPDHTTVYHALFQLGAVLWRQGKNDEAIEVLGRVLDGQTRIHGADHLRTARTLFPLARAHWNAGDLDSTEHIYRDALDRYRRRYGDDHHGTSEAMQWLGKFLVETGQYVDAEEVLREALAIALRIRGNDHRDTRYTQHLVSRALAGQHRFAEAEQPARDYLDFRRRAFGLTHNDTFFAVRVCAGILDAQGKTEEARRCVDELLSACEKQTGQHDILADRLRRFAWNFMYGEPPEVLSPALALPAARKALELSDGRQPEIYTALAHATFLNGDRIAAANMQRTALGLLPPDDSRKATFEEWIAEFEAGP